MAPGFIQAVSLGAGNSGRPPNGSYRSWGITSSSGTLVWLVHGGLKQERV